jgi:hypothetical protein
VSPFEKWLLWISTAAVAASGIALGVLKYFVSSDDPYAVVHHPLQPYVLKLHVLSAPALVFALGVVYTRHVVRQWRSGRARGRPSGVGLVATLLPMVLSGYLVQTVSSESWLFRVSMLHVAASLAYLAVLLAHQVAAWRGPRLTPPPRLAPSADPDA